MVAPQKNLAREQRGHESLHEVADPVVRVPFQIQQPLKPEAQRHTRVRVGSAEYEHERVQCDQRVQERGEWKATVRHEEQRGSDEDRTNFHEPRRAIVGTDRAPDEERNVARKKNCGDEPVGARVKIC